MIYAVGYQDMSLEQGPKIVIQKHITKEEYENHKSELAEAHKISAMDNVHNLLVQNGEEFLKYSANAENHLKLEEKVVYLEANRLLTNYLSSLSMFIDYGERYNQKHFGKEEMKKFQEKTHDFYDSHVSYRFMALMRNYTLHYAFPLSVIHQSVNGANGIFASKNTLLKFDAWKLVKEDIKQMPDLISLDVHVDISMMFLKKLFQDYVYDIAPLVLRGIEYLNGMIKDVRGKMPVLITFNSIEELRKGNLSLDIIDIKIYAHAFEIIKQHPSINITEK
ncbi:hypothetical protein MF625_004367 [Paenibacillus polymyxa]|uniref:hypothetical protein n=1 Tax=Paenibacillus polymyxa TaxID=1406 RepID=UPI00202465E3|nr:hypothetical protein [Paenibacillus polymyxa]URJ35044.1 hypothetical protein MF625_004367 [Paenibacillus polymyxa]